MTPPVASVPKVSRTGPASLPRGLRVYAVGDLHGQADLLRAMLARIEADVAARPVERAMEIFLGDYIDRGPDSCGVIEALAAPPQPGRERVCLRGNHEDTLLAFLEDPSVLHHWRDWGALPFLRSYGVPETHLHPGADPVAVRDDLLQRMPAAHLAWLRGLATRFAVGGYLFVHAGVDPRRPLEDQDERDLIWIRDRFLRYEGPLAARVVHGHTPVEMPTVRPNRINVDTGAFVTGRLTAAVIEGDEVRFLAVEDPSKRDRVLFP